MSSVDVAKPKALAVVLEEGTTGTVTLSPQNRDKFCMAVNEVVKACQLLVSGYVFFEQLKSLQSRLYEWVNLHKDRLHSAYIAFRPTGDLLFVAVQKDVTRDAELVDMMTDLDLHVAADPSFSELRLEVLSLPHTSSESLEAFLFSGRVIQHAGNGSPSPGSD